MQNSDDWSGAIRLKFLQMAKDGECVPVEKSAEAYARIEAEDRQVEEAHYYGVS